eukprot:GABV01008709.1.p1 GENE.GABV01008709.1~~GABV01008709.1.p1  ORF type:complete len:119 (-),score=19.47 GABV01008709.1:32-388(-)
MCSRFAIPAGLALLDRFDEALIAGSVHRLWLKVSSRRKKLPGKSGFVPVQLHFCGVRFLCEFLPSLWPHAQEFFSNEVTDERSAAYLHFDGCSAGRRAASKASHPRDSSVERQRAANS